jgi:beta-glucosidase
MTFDVDQVLSELTLAEKAALVSGADLWHTVAIERLGVPAIMCSDGPHGLRAQVEGFDHGGLLASVPATCFPTASAIASSWDAEVIREVGAAIAREARRWNVSVVLGPGINMKRSPLCGRNFEYFSEDPYLAGELGLALVEGVQSQGVGTSVKHFAANNQEDDRLRVSSDVDERTLREIYLPAFERIAKAGAPWTVMCGYNKVNGVYCSEHHWLLTEVLRDEWGWDGVVVSDWGAVHDRVAALRGGLDWEMPPDLERSPAAVEEAIRSGELEPDVLDTSVRRMLALIARGASVHDTDDDADLDAHHALSRRAAAASIVLLKNDGNVLPLAAEGSVAVIGEFARTPRFQGAGSSQVNPAQVDVLLDELTTLLGEHRVTFGAGYGIEDTSNDDALLGEAVALAGGADVVVCVLGLPASYESEGYDRTHIELPANQSRLLTAVIGANANVVVVLVNGSVVRLSDWADSVPAIVECWLGGQAAGGAIAEVLTGVAEPGGRLAETIPVQLSDVPSTLNFPGDSQHVRYGEGLFIGYRAHDRLGHEVTFPFGHGLSYTTFELSDIAVHQSGRVDDGDFTATVSVTVANTGNRLGSQVVQVYVADNVSSVVRPARELKGFAKVHLGPGDSQRVAIELDQRAFSFWSERYDRWVVEAGDFTIFAGTSSRDLPLSQLIMLDAPSLVEPLTRMSTLHEWRADALGRLLLDESFRNHPAFNDEHFVMLIGTMPMDTLAGFGFGLTHRQLDGLVEQWNARAVTPHS